MIEHTLNIVALIAIIISSTIFAIAIIKRHFRRPRKISIGEHICEIRSILDEINYKLDKKKK